MPRHAVTCDEFPVNDLGEEIFRASGLGAPAADETEELRRRVAELEQTMLDLRQQLKERTEELDAARATNRDLMAELNRAPARRDNVSS